MNATLSRNPPAEWSALREWAKARCRGATREAAESLVSLLDSQQDLAQRHPIVGVMLMASCRKLAEKIAEGER